MVPGSERALDPLTLDSSGGGDFPVLLFLQMPVILTRRIFGISIYNVSNYTAVIIHGATSLTSISPTK